MKLLVVSGFLGSGKTSLILRIARSLADRAETVAIIENEIGEVGIDGKYLRDKGLTVQELFGGCICCTLSANLIFTLREVMEQFAPDWAVVEPTGLATPAQVIDSVRASMPEIVDLWAIGVVDADRWDMLSKMLTPLITGQIETADLVAVNKADLVTDEVLDVVVQAVRSMRADVPVVAISAEQGQNLVPILERLT